MEDTSHSNHSTPFLTSGRLIPSETFKVSSKSLSTSLLPSPSHPIFAVQPQDTGAFWHCCQSHGGLRLLTWRTSIISLFFAPLLSQTLSPYFMVKAIFTFSFRFPGAKVLLLGSIECWVSHCDSEELVSGQGSILGSLEEEAGCLSRSNHPRGGF